MKTIPAALLTHYGLGATAFAHALLITRTDGEVFGFTSDSADVTISGQVYDASPGLDVTSIVTAAGAAVGNLELTTLHDGSVFTTAAIFGGVWRNATFRIFRYRRANPADGVDNLLAGTFGEAKIRLNTVVVELRDLRQYLQHPVGSVSQKLCRYRFGYHDTGGPDGESRCGVDILGSPGHVEVGTVTVKTSNQHFRAAAMSFAEHKFTDGFLTWLTGANAGLEAQVKTFMFEGSPSQLWFTLQQPMQNAIANGDTFSVEAGCRKRLSDCISFGNVLNFGGEPHRPGIDALTQSVTVDV